MQVVRIGQRGNSLGITLPHAYLEELRWGRGELLILETSGDRLVARPLRKHLEQQRKDHEEALEAAHGRT
jgi:antitoxin component of MazEF toxin-antitoxin module